MTAILVVVDGEVLQQLAQVIETADDGDAPEPLVLQREDDPLGDCDRAVLADRAEARFHILPDEQVAERIGGEDLVLVTDEMPRSAMLGKCILHRAHHPARVRPF